MMKLIYIYHSGFAIEIEGAGTIIIDYYKDSSDTLYNRGVVHDDLLKRPGRLYVLATHFHPDHFNKEVLQWQTLRKEETHYIFSKDILKHRRARADEAVYLKKGDRYDDGTLRVLTFGSTDVGSSFLIEAGGWRIFHAGDLNNWHWSEESNEEQIRKAEGDYLTELHDLKKQVSEVDLALFPVDRRMGKDYAKGARQFIEQIKTTIFAPMHFGEDYEGGNAFRATAEAAGVRFITIARRGETFELNK